MKNLIVTRKIIIKSIRCIEFKRKNQYYELMVDYFDYEKLISRLIFKNFKLEEKENFKKTYFDIKKVLGFENENPYIFDDEKIHVIESYSSFDAIGIFYNEDIIAITNEEEKICIDCMLNEIMLVEEFKKQFIEKRKKTLEEERDKCQKRIEEIYDELLSIL